MLYVSKAIRERHMKKQQQTTKVPIRLMLIIIRLQCYIHHGQEIEVWTRRTLLVGRTWHMERTGHEDPHLTHQLFMACFLEVSGWITLFLHILTGFECVQSIMISWLDFPLPALPVPVSAFPRHTHSCCFLPLLSTA